MEDKNDFCVTKAHRVSRHVSFQAVVPPSVAFPVNYSLPSAQQVGGRTSSFPQLTPDVRQLKKEEHEGGDLLDGYRRQRTSVIPLDCCGTSAERSKRTSCARLRNKFACLNVCKKRCCYVKNPRRTWVDSALSKRKYFLFAFILSAFISLVLIILPVTAVLSTRNVTPDICESAGCLRIGLFIKTTFSAFNQKGISNVCGKGLLPRLVKVIWDEDKKSDISFPSPLELATEEIAPRKSPHPSHSKHFNSTVEESGWNSTTANFAVSLRRILSSARRQAVEGPRVPIGQMLQEATLTFNSFDDVLQTMHMRYQIPLLFNTWTDNQTVESRFAKELRTYICISLHYAHSVGVHFHTNSSANCNINDDEHIGAVYEILARLQNVRMLQEARPTPSSAARCSTGVGAAELSAISGNMIDLVDYLRNYADKNIVRVCGVDAIKWIAGILRQTRSSDLQDYIFFSIVNKYGPRSSTRVAEAKHRLMNLAFGSIGHINAVPSVLGSALSQAREELFNNKENELNGFYFSANGVVLSSIKRTYENFFQEMHSIKQMVSRMAVGRITRSPEVPADEGPISQRREALVSFREIQGDTRRRGTHEMREPSNDIGLMTYGSKMMRHTRARNELEPSILLLYDKRMNYLEENPRLTALACLGYWISLSIAETIFEHIDGVRTGDFPPQLRSLYKCVLRTSEMLHPRPSHISATEYMSHVRIMKISLAVEMLTRAYLESKKTASFPRIPGILISEDHTFFILFIQSICTKPIYSDLGLTEICETGLTAMEMSPAFMSLASCHRTVSPKNITPTECFS